MIRRFVPLGHTAALLYFISLPFYAVVRDFYVTKNRLHFRENHYYQGQTRGFYVSEWLQKKPSEHFVKRESYNPFIAPSN